MKEERTMAYSYVETCHSHPEIDIIRCHKHDIQFPDVDVCPKCWEEVCEEMDQDIESGEWATRDWDSRYDDNSETTEEVPF